MSNQKSVFLVIAYTTPDALSSESDDALASSDSARSGRKRAQNWSKNPSRGRVGVSVGDGGGDSGAGDGLCPLLLPLVPIRNCSRSGRASVVFWYVAP